MRWGWPKSFEAKDGRARHMHAVGETIDEKVTFAESFRLRRGIAWCTTFNEGETLPNGKHKQWVCRDPGAPPLAHRGDLPGLPKGRGRLFPAFCMVTPGSARSSPPSMWNACRRSCTAMPISASGSASCRRPCMR
jgi:hypothetical protein